jgi:hypothetical protein
MVRSRVYGILAGYADQNDHDIRRHDTRVSSTFGLSTNTVLQHQTEGLLAEAVAGYEGGRQAAGRQEPARPAVPSRLFTGFWYQAGTWPQPRWVVARAAAGSAGIGVFAQGWGSGARCRGRGEVANSRVP